MLGIWTFENIARVHIEQPLLPIKLLVVTCAIRHVDVHPRMFCAVEKLQLFNHKRSDTLRYVKPANNELQTQLARGKTQMYFYDEGFYMPVEASFQTFGFLLTLYFPETWLARGMG
jgi:hypothetical protein